MKLTFKFGDSGTYFTRAYAVLNGDKLPVKYAIADAIERMGHTLLSISFGKDDDIDRYSYHFTHLVEDEDGDFIELHETVCFTDSDIEALKKGDIIEARIW